MLVSGQKNICFSVSSIFSTPSVLFVFDNYNEFCVDVI